MRTQVDDDYEATINAAIREAAAEIGFYSWHGDATRHAAGQAIYNYTAKIADVLMKRLAVHYTHTRKAKSQHKVG